MATIAIGWFRIPGPHVRTNSLPYHLGDEPPLVPLDAWPAELVPTPDVYDTLRLLVREAMMVASGMERGPGFPHRWLALEEHYTDEIGHLFSPASSRDPVE